jgi:membrane protein DedA with SNARE-associated domain
MFNVREIFGTALWAGIVWAIGWALGDVMTLGQFAGSAAIYGGAYWVCQSLWGGHVRRRDAMCAKAAIAKLEHQLAVEVEVALARQSGRAPRFD